MPATPRPPWPTGIWPRVRLLLATWGFSGYFAKGPGTAGTIAGLACLLALQATNPPQPLTWWIVSAVLAVGSVLIGRSVVHAYNLSDPSWFVLDEVAGMALALACGPGQDWAAILLAFGLFRVLDVFKPPPIAQAERLHGGLGITADDLLAGAAAGLIVHGVWWAAGLGVYGAHAAGAGAA